MYVKTKIFSKVFKNYFYLIVLVKNFLIKPSHIMVKGCWPFFASVSVYRAFYGLYYFSAKGIGYSVLPLVFGLSLCLIVMYFWFSEVFKECQKHRLFVFKLLTAGGFFFILSEVFFFFGFFWSFFNQMFYLKSNLTFFRHRKWIKQQVLYKKVLKIENLEGDVPFLKTVLLVSSGIFLTLRTQYLITIFSANSKSVWDENYLYFLVTFVVTIILGLIFLYIQLLEFTFLPINIGKKTFCSCFFLLTGFHGLHVTVGEALFIVYLVRVLNSQIGSSFSNHFKFASLYWHFVDVVWIFLFIFVYHPIKL